jgi:aminobenzoyl-glutamate transport protein
MSRGALGAIERLGNRLPDPLSLFLLLAAAVVVLSHALAGVSVAHPGTGQPVVVKSLLSRELLRDVVLVGAVKNFTGFAPLGLVLTAMIGIGVAERAGLIAALLRRLLAALPRGTLSYGVVFAGMLSHLAIDAGYVVVVPLAALLFARAGRHPLAGLAAGFAGVSGGFSATVAVGSVDALLAGLTTEAARVFDPAYEVHPAANYWFMFASVPLLVGLGGWLTDRVIEPRLGAWVRERAEGDVEAELADSGAGAGEGRALAAAALAFAAVVALFVALTLPAEAPLRDEAGTLGPFFRALVLFVMLAFALPGVAYGAFVGSVRSDRDVARMGAETMAAMGPYVLLAFAMGQFVEYFRASEIGTLVAIAGADGLRQVGLGGAPLLAGFVLLTATIDLVIGSASAKWAVMGPIFVPMLMALGYSPELTQAAYRIGDSVANVATPLMPYFPIVVAFARRWDRDAGIGTLLAAMLPYTLAFGIAWCALLLAWYAAGVPLGPGGPLAYSPAR